MTLLEHVRELRNRLFWASLGLLGGFIVGFIVSQSVFHLLSEPYCSLRSSGVDGQCKFLVLGVGDTLILRLKIALWVGIIVGAPIWLYQLWAFVAPGLHKHERRWAYWFAGIAAPLFTIGTVLAYVVVAKGMGFLLDFTPKNVITLLTISKYVKFITNFMVLFGVAFE